MCFTKYGFQTWQPYSRIGRTKVLYAEETPSELFGPKVRLIKPKTLLALALNMNCLCAIYVDRNQRAFLAQMTSFVVRYDVIDHFFPINSQYLMTWGVDSPAIISASTSKSVLCIQVMWFLTAMRTPPPRRLFLSFRYCLVPRPHYYARPMRFGSRGPRKFLRPRQSRRSETFCLTWGGAFGSGRAVNNFPALMKDVQQPWRVQRIKR